jgi:hypothetical protein
MSLMTARQKLNARLIGCFRCSCQRPVVDDRLFVPDPNCSVRLESLFQTLDGTWRRRSTYQRVLRWRGETGILEDPRLGPS